MEEMQINPIEDSLNDSSPASAAQVDGADQPTSAFEPLYQAVAQIRSSISSVIVGQQNMIDLIITGLLSGGHILIEGVPGVAKTLAAKLLARSIDLPFSRIQFTPDLMPSDVLGTSVFNPKEVDFQYKQGPVFANIVLIDEINRAPAKTQAALFEVMEEQQVTNDGTTYALPQPFLVVATQNPIEQEGTYRLPEAQLDRFLFKINVGYPSFEDEVRIMDSQQYQGASTLLKNVHPVLTGADISSYKSMVSKITMTGKLLEFIARIVTSTRNNNSLFLGASPRASLAIMQASKAFAAINGRSFVLPEDVITIAPHVLRHRIILTPEKEMEGIVVDDMIQKMIATIEIPR